MDEFDRMYGLPSPSLWISNPIAAMNAGLRYIAERLVEVEHPSLSPRSSHERLVDEVASLSQ